MLFLFKNKKIADDRLFKDVCNDTRGQHNLLCIKQNPSKLHFFIWSSKMRFSVMKSPEISVPRAAFTAPLQFTCLYSCHEVLQKGR